MVMMLFALPMEAAKVTYHILTLPIDNEQAHMVSAVNGHRLEALKVVVDNQTTVELPAHFKSPLATNFKYYLRADIEVGSTISLYATNKNTKGTLHDIKVGSEAKNVAEGTVINGSSAEYYVVYTYNTENTILKLDGSEDYNIGVKGKGFLALNRGRNNRPAVVPAANVDPGMLSSEYFSRIENPGGGISTYWSDATKNKNKKEETGSQFHFIFRFEGEDPYNIIIRSAYHQDVTFIEANEDSDNKNYVYKWYKGAQLFTVNTGNAFLSSDINHRYLKQYNSSEPNPTSLTPGTDYETKEGYFRSQTGNIWGTVALLNNTTNTGHVFMGTRTVDGNGNVPTQGSDNQYYYLKFDNNNLTFGKLTPAKATSTYTIEGLYEVRKVTFKVPTPFYAVEATEDHIISVSDLVSKYTVENDPIETKYLPQELHRKYCSFNGKFYKDAARSLPITHFSEATDDPTEGYQVYLGYEVSGSIPFEAISPSAAYSSARWYELTDAGSTQEYGRKIQYDGISAYKNNGANGDYTKQSEFAFVGDPYELKVLYRDSTERKSENHYVTLSTYDAWDIPVDAVDGSFLLRKYNSTGYWYWETGEPSNTVAYESNLSQDVNKEAQTITFTITGLNGSKYIMVSTGGAGVAQILSVSPSDGSVTPETGTTATVTVNLAENTGESPKVMTVTIQECNDNEGSSLSSTASVITITQGTSSSSFAGNTVDYHATNSTRVKVMNLPQFTYMYNMVDNAGLIAVKGTATQTIFTPLTKAGIPSAIFSPFLVDETVSFYSTFSAEGSRSNLSGLMTETPAADNANIYVSYKTDHLTDKSIKLDDVQQFNVQLNGEYIYWNGTKIVSNAETTSLDLSNEAYLWKLPGGDPYSMKIYNVGKGEYVDVASWADDEALGFDAFLDNASRFVAMLSNYSGVYEVLAATGTTDYYRIGRPSSENAEVKMYSNATYAHGTDQLRFELAGKDPIRYTLIDLNGDSLLTVSSNNPRLTLPAEYVSPLVETYYYYPTKAEALTHNKTNNITELEDDDGDNHVWVRYDVNDLIGFNNTGRVNDHPYLLKFLNPYAAGYYLEDGNDKLADTLAQAVYPYCNGDGNLNIYCTSMRDEQMGGGSNTRPRWVWFFESANSDPYHVRVRSRSTISYSGVSNPTYLETKAVNFKQDPSRKQIVTGGAMPGVASESPTEYMILGLPGAYKLVTTKPIDNGSTNERRTVNSLEQYWKTYNMIKLHVLGILPSTDEYSTDESTWVVPADKRALLNERLEALGIGSGNWHSYDVYANATRWNGYNDKESGHEKKVVEKLEHWFQTFDMGNGTFAIESADIPPVLVLLDNHGWEIMRRPLPAANYPEGEEQKAALRVYDSPMVDKYYFYSNATKASGCHKYSIRLDDKGQERDRITVNGEHYCSSSLGELPPADAKGVKSNGVLNDQYVIYSVKEEYAANYNDTLIYTGDKDAGYTITKDTYGTRPYMVLQNDRFYKVENEPGKLSYLTKPIFEHTNTENGTVYDLIVTPKNSSVVIVDGSGKFLGNTFWYVRPNLHIDEEMGIKWGASNSGGEPLTQAATKVSYSGSDPYRNKNGFDPYNIQLQLKNKTDGTADGRFLTTHMTSTRLDNGIMVGDYSGSGGTTLLTLEAEYDDYTPRVNKGSEGYDHTNLQMSNQTFMVVSDANGNMQLMPRFDHTKRVNVPRNKISQELLWASTLEDPVDHTKASIEDINSMGPQTTFFIRPQRYIYHIIDNDSLEALRYLRGGDDYPTVTEHFKSPLAKDFTFYKDDKLTQQITGSFAAANFTNGDDEDIDVYVRYRYDEDADMDADRILLGKWFTVQLAGKDLQASGSVVIQDNPETVEEEVPGTGVRLYADNTDSPTRPGTINKNAKAWQWKFLAAPMDSILSNGDPNPFYRAPDPYSIKLYNREANYASTLDEPSPMRMGVKVPDDGEGFDRFALLLHPNGGYAFAVAKEYTDTKYLFLNGADMTTSVPADTATESAFTYKYGNLSAGAQVELNSDVVYQYAYRVITNESLLAITGDQDNEEASTHDYAPYLPDSVQSPLLNMEDYLYYGFANKPTANTFNVVTQTKLHTLYGLYDDTVYVRYQEYDVDRTNFKIPNKRNATGTGKVLRHDDSHDVSMNLNGGLPYNIIWYNDNMMATETAESTSITDEGSHELSGDMEYVWYFKGNDPYAIVIEHKQTGLYVNGTATLQAEEANAKRFMLLRKPGYPYGILQVSGTGSDTGKKLTGYGASLTADASTAPTQFIIFGLSVHDLIFRLIIAETGKSVIIPHREGDEDDYTVSYTWSEADTKTILGTTKRDLTTAVSGIAGDKYQLGSTITWGGDSHTYCYDAGTVSIGDDMWVPNVFYRPNCTFEFYVEGIYGQDKSTADEPLNNRFRGLKINKLMSASELIDMTVVVNIVYSFDKDLATNTGLGFVTDVAQNLWYTFETPSGATPYLAHYTNAWGLQSMPGRETRYTNDYLWTPLGDVYGFEMYNRYMLKNSDGARNVMTMAAITDDQNIILAEPGEGGYEAGNEIFELISGDQEGYFRVHPVKNNSGTQYYVRRDPSDNYTKLSTTPSDWRFGLDSILLAPYYERAGYVGGLNEVGKAAYEAAVASGKITDVQNVVYNDDHIIPFTPGYYRLHNQPGVSGISPVRYASGYLHGSEMKVVDGGIPMHFYSRAGISTLYMGEDGLGGGFTITKATQGEIPIDSTEMDPSTIFYFPGGCMLEGNARSTMQTQGLYVAANGQRAAMTDNAGDAVTFSLMDIGGAVLLIHDGSRPAERLYLNYDQRKTDSIYDLKYYHDASTDDAKWCMQPVQKTTTAGNGEMPLVISTNNGGDGYYYATFYAPFDVLLPANVQDTMYYAYTCRKWYDEGVNPVPVPAVGGYAEGKFIPAATPVIIRTTDESDCIMLTLPSDTPSVSLSPACVFIGSYLDTLLAVDADHDVYTFGLPMVSNVSKDKDYVTSGGITAPLPDFDNTGVGFYINATRNKEANALEALWTRNNRYVLHNKIYYRGTGTRAAAAKSDDVVYVPVFFDKDDAPEEPDNNDRGPLGDGCVYDLLGRKVATDAQVQDGSWYLRLQPGIYIINGKKVSIQPM